VVPIPGFASSLAVIDSEGVWVLASTTLFEGAPFTSSAGFCFRSASVVSAGANETTWRLELGKAASLTSCFFAQRAGADLVLSFTSSVGNPLSAGCLPCPSLPRPAATTACACAPSPVQSSQRVPLPNFFGNAGPSATPTSLAPPPPTASPSPQASFGAAVAAPLCPPVDVSAGVDAVLLALTLGGGSGGSGARLGFSLARGLSNASAGGFNTASTCLQPSF
jgi:hypothetical protein